MGARFYDPQSGRFLSPDPLGHAATPDLYSYAGGDPINGIDYDGRINRQTFDLQMSGLWQGPDFGSVGFMDSWTKQLNDWRKEPEWMQPKMSGLDQLQNVLDYVGMVPVIGNVADGLNVVISTLRGNYADAAIRAAFMAPGVGIGAAATYKLGKMGYRALSGLGTARKAFTPMADQFSAAMRTGKARGMINVPGVRFGGGAGFKAQIPLVFNKTHKSSMPSPKGRGPNGGLYQSHHGLQQEWAKQNLKDYNYDPGLAPSVTLETGIGHPHTVITNLQRARRDARVAAGQGKWSSSLQEELGYIVDDFRAAGYGNDVIQQVLEQQYKMLDKIGVPYQKIKL